MQTFITRMYEEVCMVLGQSGAAFGLEFYSSLVDIAAADPVTNAATGGVGVKLVTSVALAGFEMLPYQWLRTVLKTFLRPFLTHCPLVQVNEFVGTIVSDLVQFRKWQS